MQGLLQIQSSSIIITITMIQNNTLTENNVSWAVYPLNSMRSIQLYLLRLT